MSLGTHSSQSWSYHLPTSVAWPRETVGSMHTSQDVGRAGEEFQRASLTRMETRNMP